MSIGIDFAALGLPSMDKTGKAKVPVSVNTPLEDGKIVASKDGKKRFKIVAVLFTVLNLGAVYGNKKANLKRDAEKIGKIESFLRAVYDSRTNATPADDDDADDASESENENASVDTESTSFEEWRDRLAARSANAILAQRAAGVAKKANRQNSTDVVATINAQSNNDSLDDDAIAKMRAALDAAEKRNAEKKAKQNQTGTGDAEKNASMPSASSKA